MESKKVLIVDDDESLVRSMTVRCRHLDLAVTSAPNATAAISEFRKNLPDLFILDMNMPGGGAEAVCQALATDPQTAQIPVIILTGDTDNTVMHKCLDYGAFYVPKSPYSWQTLKPMIGRLLNIPQALQG